MTARRWMLAALPVIAAAGAFLLLPRTFIHIPREDGLELRHRIFGFSSDDEHGHSLGGVGDIDGDGFADFAIGAPYHEGGVVRVHSGKTGATIFEISGRPPQDLGCAVAGAGDVDADGTPDFIAGIEGESGSAPGRAEVYSGKTGALIHSFEGTVERDLFGHAVAAAGDVDRDGYGDVIVGAPGTWKRESIGYARVFSGKDGRVLFTFQGERFVGDRFGFAVAGAGDVNRDGHADVLVGALGDTKHGAHSGRVYLFSGADGRKLRTFDGDRAYDELGHSVAGAGDLDGDGHPDLFAGAFLQKGIGYARAYSGRTGRVLFEMRGIEVADAFGHSVASAGDVDGDGVMDLVVGAPDATIEGAKRAGYVRIYSGKDGRLLLHHTGTRERMHYGYVVASAGDVNGDFLDDVLVGTVVVKDVGVAEVISACAIDPIEVQGELTLRRTREGFLVFGGAPGETGTLRVTDPSGAVLLEERFTFGSGAVPFSMIRPELASRTLHLEAVRTGTVAARSGVMKVRFCP